LNHPHTQNLTPNPNDPATPRPLQVVRIALIQHACTNDPHANLDRATQLIRQAASCGAHIVATQELFTATYFPQVEDENRFQLAETIPGPTTDHLCKLAGQLHIEITASLFEKRTQGLYHNTSVMISPHDGGKIIGRYRKMHIPDDPRFYEKFYFTPGDLGWQTQLTRHARTGMLVCWDQWFPEAARLTALRGAQILFYPTAIGWHHAETPDERARQIESWQIMQRAHAIANGVFVAAINRVGTESDLTFWGNSFVANPGGQIIAQASSNNDQVLLADCDLALIDQARQAWPFFRDRRTDAYHDLTRRFND
jgi:N-carbamoylputrescine amidase